MDKPPDATFTIEVRGQDVVVEYREQYIGSPHFAYLSPHDPLRPHPLSETGYRSQFVSRAAVDAAGPAAYAARYAEVLLAEKEGRGPKKPPGRRKGKGGHAERAPDELRREAPCRNEVPLPLVSGVTARHAPPMPERLTQQVFDFENVPLDAPPDGADSAAEPRPVPEPCPGDEEEVTAAVGRLEDWLTDTSRGRMTGLAEEAIYAVRQALLEGQNSWSQKAEDLLETLKLRNGRREGDDIPESVAVADGDDFIRDLDSVLDRLYELLSW